MRDLLAGVMEEFKADYLEMRYHAREVTSISVATDALEQANSTEYTGVGIRTLVNGAWGFGSTSKLDKANLRLAAGDALKAARVASSNKSQKITGLAEAKMAHGRFRVKENGPLSDVSLEEKMGLVVETEKMVRKKSKSVKSAICHYRELLDRKIILNTDGADAEVWEARPELWVTAVAAEGGKMVSITESDGVAGGWKDLFRRRSPEEMAEKAAKTSSALLKAKFPKGEKTTVILDPSMVGLLAHEAFGHTAEADFVLSGSAAKGKLGKKVASELVTLVDDGQPNIGRCPAGTLMVDDEGVLARRSVIIEKGIMKSYLFDREIAHIFGLEPRGNARAFEYSDEPLVRMRNTYVEPGDWKLDEIIGDTRQGYLLVNGFGGQADANAEFMFITQEAYEVRNGEVGKLLRGVTLSGNAFDVLGSVDAVGRDFDFNMGSGYCGKGQPAKVDGGGGHIRCKAIVGGRKEG